MLSAVVNSQVISISKDSLYLAFDDAGFTSSDSIIVYNSGSDVLEINDIYSVYASGFLLDIYLADTLIYANVVGENQFPDTISISANDSAKLVFSYPLWVPKHNVTNEV